MRIFCFRLDEEGAQSWYQKVQHCAGPLRQAPSTQVQGGNLLLVTRDRATSLIQRMIEPEEIASMVAYLASPLSAATNGAAFSVDGGITPTIV